MGTPRVVVVGAGVIGLSCGWRLAEAGLDVTVVDPAPGSGASSVAAGMLAPMTEAHPTEAALLRLSLASALRYPRFVADLEDLTGLEVGYRTSGTLVTALDAADEAQLAVLAGHLERLGLAAEPLTGRACREAEPALSSDTRAGLLVPEDHSVDNRALVRALLSAVDRSGARLVAARVAAIDCGGEHVSGEHASGVVRGVVLDSGESLSADVVVVAAGCRSADLHPRLRGLVRPVKGEVLRLRRTPGALPLDRTVRAQVAGRSVYLVPRDNGELVVGATQLEAGFDTTVRAGAVHALLRDARLVVPSVDEYTLAESAAGLRPGSPDNTPLLGAIGPDGLLVATGHHRDGILLAPITADTIVELATLGTTPGHASDVSPRRFIPGGQRCSERS